MKNFRVVSMLVMAMTAGLTGCFSTTRSVLKTQAPEVYQTESVQQVEKGISDRDAAIRTLNAQVEITAATGGSKEGKIKVYTSFRGYIFIQKPADLRVILQLPILGSRALDMVSNGETFTLMHASSDGNVWVQGSDKVKTPSKNGLENLRPAVFLDSLLVPGVRPDEFVTLTETSRDLEGAKHAMTVKHAKTVIREPDYTLGVLKKTTGNVLEVQRVVRIDRVSMLPFEQDIYDDKGQIVTQAMYDGYQSYGGQEFPSVITILRPLDEYSLKIDVTKLTLNETFEADQFVLKIPEGAKVRRMQ